MEALPSYAPDLNPVEWLWQHVKDVELHNLTCLDLEQLHMELHLAWAEPGREPNWFNPSLRRPDLNCKNLTLLCNAQ